MALNTPEIKNHKCHNFSLGSVQTKVLCSNDSITSKKPRRAFAYDSVGLLSPPFAVGLSNLGNTCYLNSIVQVLCQTPGLDAAFLKTRTSKGSSVKGSDSTVAKEWLALQDIIKTSDKTVAPVQFLKAVRAAATVRKNEALAHPGQNDAAEFLQFFFECAHTDMCRCVVARVTGVPENTKDKLAHKCYSAVCATYAREYSELMELIYGVSASVLASPKTGEILSVVPEMYASIDLSIPDGARTIEHCFAGFSKPELLEDDNAWYNEAVGAKESVVSYSTFWSFPKVLIIVLKRFSPCGRFKNNACIEFPLTGLNLSEFTCGYRPAQYVYDLYGVCNHHGGVGGGHYTSSVCGSDGIWREFDDERVSYSPMLITSAAYILFYKKNNAL